MRCLHGKRYAYAERRQRDHRRGAHPDKDHLPEDRRNLEKLPRERRNENPIQQTEIKSDVIFHLLLSRAECQAARTDESRNFRAAQCWLGGFTEKRQWPEAKSMLSARY